MQTLGAFQVKTHFSSILEQVEKGEHVIITKHGRPVARLIPEKGACLIDIHETIRRIKVFNKKHNLGNLNWKTLRDEGRR